MSNGNGSTPYEGHVNFVIALLGPYDDGSYIAAVRDYQENQQAEFHTDTALGGVEAAVAWLGLDI